MVDTSNVEASALRLAVDFEDVGIARGTDIGVARQSALDIIVAEEIKARPASEFMDELALVCGSPLREVFPRNWLGKPVIPERIPISFFSIPFKFEGLNVYGIEYDCPTEGIRNPTHDVSCYYVYSSFVFTDPSNQDKPIEVFRRERKIGRGDLSIDPTYWALLNDSRKRTKVFQRAEQTEKTTRRKFRDYFSAASMTNHGRSLGSGIARHFDRNYNSYMTTVFVVIPLLATIYYAQKAYVLERDLVDLRESKNQIINVPVRRSARDGGVSESTGAGFDYGQATVGSRDGGSSPVYMITEESCNSQIQSTLDLVLQQLCDDPKKLRFWCEHPQELVGAVRIRAQSEGRTDVRLPPFIRIKPKIVPSKPPASHTQPRVCYDAKSKPIEAFVIENFYGAGEVNPDAIYASMISDYSRPSKVVFEYEILDNGHVKEPISVKKKTNINDAKFREVEKRLYTKTFSAKPCRYGIDISFMPMPPHYRKPVKK